MIDFEGFDVNSFINNADFTNPSWVDGLEEMSALALEPLTTTVHGNEDMADLVFGSSKRADDYANLSSDGSVRDAFSQPTGLLSTASGWIKDNPKLAELLLKGAGGAWAAGKAGETALASTKLQEEIANRKRERIQQSIMGMAEMPRGEQSPLTRMNGSRVYNDKGGLA